MGGQNGSAHYWAFISYSHNDEAWGRWLHRALETYRVPRNLVGKQTGAGVIPRRLMPIFRDRDELPSSAELAATINAALSQSRFQIVICSPHAASSRWVNEEIKTFKQLGREHRVLALIVDGAPNASEAAGSGLAECFPRALRYRLDERGEIGARKAEVVAADARKGRDGRDNAKLKIIAGLLGVGFDELKQRERTRRRWQWVLRSVAAAAVIAVVGGVLHAQQAVHLEQERSAHLDRLVELGKKELAGDEFARAATYLNEAYTSGMSSADVRFLLARALPSVEAMNLKSFHATDGFYVDQLSYTPDGRSLLVVEHSDTPMRDIARVIDAENGHQATVLEDCPYSPSIHFSADGRRVLLVGPSSVLRKEWRTQVFSLDDGLRLLNIQSAADSWREDGWPVFAGFMGDPALRHVTTVDGGGRAHVWDVDDGIHRVLQPDRQVVSSAFAEDGSELVTGGEDGEIDVWNPTAGKILRKIQVKPRRPVAAFFLGQRIVSLGESGAINLWNRASGEWEGGFSGHGRKVSQVLPAAANHLLLTSAEREPVRVWDVREQQSTFSLQENSDEYSSFDISRDGVGLMAGAADRHVAVVFSVKTGARLATLDGHVGIVTTEALSPDASRAATTGADGLIREWDLARIRSVPLQLLAHDAAAARHELPVVYWVGYIRSDGSMVSVGTDGIVRRWNNDENHPVQLLRGGVGAIHAGSLSADGRRLIIGGVDGTAQIWDLSNGGMVAALTGWHRHPIERVAISGDGKRAATMDFVEPTAYVWDSDSGRQLASLQGHTAPLRSVRFTNDNAKLITASADKSAKIWDAQSGKLLVSLSGHADTVWAAVPSPDGQRIVTVSADHSAKLWNAQDGKLLQTVTVEDAGALESATFAHDSSRVAIGSNNGMVLLWDLHTGDVRKLTGLDAGFSDQVAFSPDESLVTSPSVDSSELGVWSVATGRLLMKWKDPKRQFFSVAFSPDGKRLVAAGPTSGDTADFPVFDVSLETRTPEQIAAIIRCKSPWKVDGERLLPHAPEAPNCPGLVDAPR